MKFLDYILESVRKYSRRQKATPPPLPPVSLGTKRPQSPGPTRSTKPPPLPPPLPNQVGKKEPDLLVPRRPRLVQSGGAARFVYEGERMGPIVSSNVAGMTYSVDKQELVVEYDSGAVWQYGNISEQEALWFYDAGSKGTMVWDIIRVRGKGNRHKHKKPAIQLR